MIICYLHKKIENQLGLMTKTQQENKVKYESS